MQKVALVTGAAAGIGRACSLRLAVEGHAVGVLDVNRQGCEQVVAEIVAQSGKALALQASIANRAEVDAAVSRLRASFGPVTVLVNNAGIAEFVPFQDITDQAWDRMMEINLKGAFIVTQVVLPDMLSASQTIGVNGGRIVS